MEISKIFSSETAERILTLFGPNVKLVTYYKIVKFVPIRNKKEHFKELVSRGRACFLYKSLYKNLNKSSCKELLV